MYASVCYQCREEIDEWKEYQKEWEQLYRDETIQGPERRRRSDTLRTWGLALEIQFSKLPCPGHNHEPTPE